MRSPPDDSSGAGRSWRKRTRRRDLRTPVFSADESQRIPDLGPQGRSILLTCMQILFLCSASGANTLAAALGPDADQGLAGYVVACRSRSLAILHFVPRAGALSARCSSASPTAFHEELSKRAPRSGIRKQESTPRFPRGARMLRVLGIRGDWSMQTRGNLPDLQRRKALSRFRQRF